MAPVVCRVATAIRDTDFAILRMASASVIQASMATTAKLVRYSIRKGARF